MDQQLRYHVHAGRMAKRGLRAAQALRRLKGLQPRVTRQLYTSMVTPVIDYASVVWSTLASSKIVTVAEHVQRLGATAVIAGFKTVSLVAAEAEAALVPVRTRWAQQLRRFWADLHTLPAAHPLWRIKAASELEQRRFASPMHAVAGLLAGTGGERLERIEAFCLSPWKPRANVRILLRDQAEELAKRADLERAVFTRASSRNDRVGIGVAYLGRQAHRMISKTLGLNTSLNAHHGELVALYEACRLIDQRWPDHDTDPRTPVRILSSSRSALEVLAKPRQQAGQWIIRQIYHLLDHLAASWKPRVVFQWIPSSADIRGIQITHDLARRATFPNRQVPSSMKLKSTASRTPLIAHHERRKQWETRSGGKYTKLLDRALPGKHTRKLYDNLRRDEAQILAQLRTGKSRLNSALHVVKAVESDHCERCGCAETVRHFLTECQHWTTQRQQHLQTVTDRWTDVPFLLGAWTNERVDGPRENWKPNREAVRATIAFAKATGRLSVGSEETR
jgi:hypothetical protein